LLKPYEITEPAHLEQKPVRILLVEDVGDHAEFISSVLHHMDEKIEVVSAESAAKAIELARTLSFDLILSDYRLGPIDCFQMIEELKNKGISIPIIILTGQGNEEVAAKAISRGAEDYLIKDAIFKTPSQLLRSVNSAVERHWLQEALREREEQYRSLVVNVQDGVVIIKEMVLEFVNPAFAALFGVQTDLLIGVDFPSLIPHEQRPSAKALIASAWKANQPVEGEFTLMPSAERMGIYINLKLSKCTFTGEPALIGTVRDITRQKLAELKLQETLQHMEKLSVTDDLTGLFNRRHALTVASNEVERSKRYGSHLGLIMIDVDRFKEINDKYGHLVGDEVLITVANALKANVRTPDTVARYGGDEFVVILPEAEIDKIRSVAERLRDKVAEQEFITGDNEQVSLTISIGITQLRDGEDTLENLIKRADTALYTSKGKGRNAVHVEL
jgi:diguanylate cyclase (GGDEF)-like protein/PAS domain S-box-containing protein